MISDKLLLLYFASNLYFIGTGLRNLMAVIMMQGAGPAGFTFMNKQDYEDHQDYRKLQRV